MWRYSELKPAVIIPQYTKHVNNFWDINQDNGKERFPHSVVSGTKPEVIKISASLIFICKNVEVLSEDHPS